MAVNFSIERMAQVIENHELWWEGKLHRPLIKLSIGKPCPDLSEKAPLLTQSNCTDFRWSPEEIIDTLDHVLSYEEYLGDGFPTVNFDAFGPGVLAAMCGARLDNSSGRVWFFPEQEQDIQDIHIRYDPDNIYAKRIKAIYRAGIEKWNGSVILGLPDLGGVMDVAATFRGSENLLLDLYDAPKEVLRLNQEIQNAWYDAYEDFSAVLAPQKCFTDWNGLLSRTPAYVLQCDFSYMISNSMFRQFVLETLREDTQRLDHTIYHLDGIGELNHLDDILSLKSLNAVQWVYGDGQPSAEHWLDVYRRIQNAGKGYMVVSDAESYLKVISVLHGSPFARFHLDSQQIDLAQAVLNAR